MSSFIEKLFNVPEKDSKNLSEKQKIARNKKLLARRRKKGNKKSNDTVSGNIMWYRRISKDTVLLKNGGFMKCFEIQNYDTTFLDNIDEIIRRLNRTIKAFESGITFHYETQKYRISKEKEKISEFAPIPTMLAQNHAEHLFENVKLYEIKHYISISYFPDFVRNRDFESFLSGNSSNSKSKAKQIAAFKKTFADFESKVDFIMSFFRNAILDYKLLGGQELMEFLYSTVNTVSERRIVRPLPFDLDLSEYLTANQIEVMSDGCLRLSGGVMSDEVKARHNFNKPFYQYIKVINIKTFPNRVVPQILSEIEELPFSLRAVTRFIGLDALEGKALAKAMQKYHFGKRYTLMQNILNALNTGRSPAPDNGNENEIRKAQEAKYASEEIERNQTTLGYYTFSIILDGTSMKEVNKKAEEVKKVIAQKGFVAVDDKMNLKETFFGAVPGDMVHNRRKVLFDSLNLSFMLPISSKYDGNKYNEHFKAPCVMTAFSGNELFYLNNMVDKDIGHTIILGPTGKGKSVFLNTFNMNFLKYAGTVIDKKTGHEKKVPARVIMFDKGGSSKVLCECVGGRFYDLGADGDIGFQPLRYIDDGKEYEFFFDWIISLIEVEYPSIFSSDTKGTKKEAIKSALQALQNFPPEKRTMTVFSNLVTDVELRSALKTFTRGDVYGTYFDNNKDNLNFENMTVFEMDNLLEKSQESGVSQEQSGKKRSNKIFQLIIEYVFHRIREAAKDGVPTLFVIDEAGRVIFDNEILTLKIKGALKEMRKMNVSIVFATQSLADVDKDYVKQAVNESCQTKIFLQNERSTEKKNVELYTDFGLSKTAILALRDMEPKRDYLYSSKYGLRIFQLPLTATELAYVGSASAKWKKLIDTLEEDLKFKYSDRSEYLKKLNIAFLNARGYNYISVEEQNENKNLIEGYKLITDYNQ